MTVEKAWMYMALSNDHSVSDEIVPCVFYEETIRECPGNMLNEYQEFYCLLLRQALQGDIPRFMGN
ncbi:hypothetical protein NB643_02330 [Oxalobacter aliiformigenes]|uniref:Uncharacterized protein n=1 Tax=Oxalobacter aliiformigenes TaxID=2946593 RepID=A0ABY7JJZ1_9BURK|nr:hypothetical protein [Oxalobacter aliiformigenes]WAV92874.1 hypothetical protein NB641_08790 [Oxalobacter aliiformigenes]WAV95623.1 hypothetical protein NB643_02330 [Oxalobacter aliiformigenes]WAV96584.1 hypothetical protein NB645_07060 [Oxalobacter aliiformigenes]